MLPSKRRASYWLLATFATLTSLTVACQPDSGPTSPVDGELSLAGKPAAGDPTVASTDPTSAPQDTTLDVHVLGSGYDRGSRVDLALDGQTTPKVQTNSTRYVTSRELVANITIAADAVTDLYDVIVTTSQGKRGIGIEMFEVRLGHANPQTGYTKVVLDGLPGASSCDGLAINESTEIVGSCWLRKGGRHAFFWSAGAGMIDLGPGEAQELSDFGGPVIVGWRGDSENPIPVVWELSTGPSPIDLPQGRRATGVNGAGDKIAGQASFIVSGQTQSPPVVWSRESGGWTPQALALPAGYETGFAEDMSTNGVVVGALGPSTVPGSEWFVWFPPYLEAERLPLGNYTYVLARAINDDGDVAGTSTACCSAWRSLFWKRNGFAWDAVLDIGIGAAQAINNLDVLTGEHGSDVYVWSVGTGRIELGREKARDINDAGEIVGTDNRHVVIWLPPQ